MAGYFGYIVLRTRTTAAPAITPVKTANKNAVLKLMFGPSSNAIKL